MAYEPYRKSLKRLNVPANKYDLWKKTANTLKLSTKAKQRLEWIIYYYTKSNNNVSLTCRHFGISRSKWYFWINRFNEANLRTLEDESTAPKHTRQKEYTPNQYERVVKLRKKYIRYGKVKIFILYKKGYPQDKEISEWKIQCIIQDCGIYYNPQKQQRTNKKRTKSQNKKRIAELKKKPKTGFLLCMDSMIRYIHGQKRYIITAIDKYSRIGYARMYKNHNSSSTKDFLHRLYYLLDGRIENVQTDNGSEFMKYFNTACLELKLDRYFSRVRTPQDNPNNERFNRIIKDEFISLGNMTSDITIFNKNLTEWLIEYNFNRPHQSLEYLAPVEFTQKYSKVSKRWSSSTNT